MCRNCHSCILLFLKVTPVACQEPLGVESGNVTDEQFTASSYDGKLVAANAILNQETAWVPKTNDQNQWLQIDLYRQILVTGVVIQGRPDIQNWVTRYRVEYALDEVSWEFVKDKNASAEVCNVIEIKQNLVLIIKYRGVSITKR